MTGLIYDLTVEAVGFVLGALICAPLSIIAHKLGIFRHDA